MESEGFDALSRSLARSGSRRGALATIVALAGAGGLATHGLDAKKKKKKKKKRCKSAVGSCTSESQCCGDLVCQEVPNCPESGTYCCGLPGENCEEHCDCCGDELCVLSKCCGRTNDPCLTSDDCCEFFECNLGTNKCEGN